MQFDNWRTVEAHSELQDISGGFWLRLVVAMIPWIVFLWGGTMLFQNPQQYIGWILLGILGSEIGAWISW